MTLTDFIKAHKNKNKMPLPDLHKSQVEACLAIQVHTTGARPAFYSNSGYVEPETYNKKFDNLFKNRLFNRHPNENPSHYNWRLSVYSPVAKELYDKFMNLCNGAILQPNNYVITSSEDVVNEWVNNNISGVLSKMVSFVLQNPYGYLVAMTKGEFSSSEIPTVCMEFVSPMDVIMCDSDTFAFYNDGYIVYIDKEAQYTINTKTYEAILAPHVFNELPIVPYQNSFLQPYQFWSDSLVRNMNDDEAMVKHYSYPIVQIVEQECYACHGVCNIPNPEYDPLTNIVDAKIQCSTCNGRGTISRNPGDFVTINEETIARNGGTMFDVAKFHTPDVGIPEYHLKRWQVFYERCEMSLHLRSTNDVTQSGEAKKEDRKDQYYFLQSISTFIFELLKDGLGFVGRYLSNGKKSDLYLVAPKQFDLMSDSDIINEFALLQGKTDDSQTLSELSYIVNQKVFRSDSVQLKINEVLYLADSLFGVSGLALKTKLLSGVYTSLDKIIHEKGYKILLNYANEITFDKFVQEDVKKLIDILNDRANTMIPQGIYGFDN